MSNLRRRLGWACALILTAAAMTAPDASATRLDFGPNITIFDPTMPVTEIQATLDAAHAQQVDDEMGTRRHAFLFAPGTYGSVEHPLQVKVGYYTEIAGLGASPNDV